MTLLAVLEAAVPAVAFLLMTAVGLDVTREDLRRVARQPGLIAAATLGQTIGLPVAALLLIRALPSEALVAEYLLLVAACPGGGMSNVYVYLARANTALSVILTALSCLLAVVTMPAVMAGYAFVLGRAGGFALPLPALLGQLLIMAVIPVTLGALVRDRWPDLERRHGGHLRALSAAGVVAIVAIGLIQSAGSLTVDLLAGGVAAAGLVAGGMLIGWTAGMLLRTGAADRFTLAVEFAVRNLAIAMVIEVTLLHHPDFVAVGALALMAQAGFLMAAVRVYRQSGCGAP
jgi:BASS family bile acid:Na+ symporter